MPDDHPQPIDEAKPTHEAQPVTPTGRERLTRALRSPGRGQVVVAVLLAALGFGAVVQVRTTADDNSFAGYRESDLVEVLSGLAGTAKRAQVEIDRLEEARRSLRSQTDARQEALAQAQQRAQTLSILAGLVPVTGSGIRVTISEDTGTVTADTMVDAVQELRTAGAEAIQLNGTVRLVAQSSFSDATGGLVVDGQRISPPYVMDVIGQPDALEGALTFPYGPRQQLLDAGTTVQIQKLDSLDITATTQLAQQRYADPA